jgi:hypothetical protein
MTVVRGVVEGLLAEEMDTASTPELLERIPKGLADPPDAMRLGMALSSMGIPGRRVRRDEVRFRAYELRPSDGRAPGTHGPSGQGPGVGQAPDGSGTERGEPPAQPDPTFQRRPDQ